MKCSLNCSIIFPSHRLHRHSTFGAYIHFQCAKITNSCVCVCVCRMHFKEEVLRKRYDDETGSRAEEKAIQEAEEHQVLMALNNQENARLRKLRWASYLCSPLM